MTVMTMAMTVTMLAPAGGADDALALTGGDGGGPTPALLLCVVLCVAWVRVLWPGAAGWGDDDADGDLRGARALVLVILVAWTVLVAGVLLGAGGWL